MRRFIYLLVVVAVAVLVAWWFTPPPKSTGPRPIVQAFSVGSALSVTKGRVDTVRSCEGNEVFVQLDRAVGEPLTLETKVEPAGAAETRLEAVQPSANRGRTALKVEGRVAGPVTVWVRAPGQNCTLGGTCPKVTFDVTAGRGCKMCAPERTVAVEPAPASVEQICDRSVFYVDAAQTSLTPCADFPNRLRAALEAELNQGLPLRKAICAWLPGQCTRPCGGAQEPPALPADHDVRIAVEPVLRDGPGRNRFWQVRYLLTTPAGETPIEVPADRACDAIARLRAATDTVARAMLADAKDPTKTECSVVANPQQCGGQYPDYDFKIGFECPMRPTQVQTHLADGTTTWHLDRLRDGNPPARAQLISRQKTQVWLLDTGIDAAMRDANGVRVETFNGRFPDPKSITGADGTERPDRHDHGGAMARLIRQVAPKAAIASVRVFDAKARARTADLAQALHAVGEQIKASPDTAHLINLSLGWPAEFSQPVLVRGKQRRFRANENGWVETACETTSDGVGEPVRFMLGELARADAAGEARVSVFAAGGNLPPVGIDLAQRAADLGVSCADISELKDEALLAHLEAVYTPDASWQPNPREQNVPPPMLRFFEAFRLEWSRARSRDQLLALVTGLDPELRRAVVRTLPGYTAWCAPDGSPLGPRPFLPGGWGIGEAKNGALLGAPRLAMGNTCVRLPLTTAVGAIDVRDRLVLHHDGVDAPALLAPGAHVWVQSPDRPTTPTAPGCTGFDPVPDDAPVAVTGTSVSTALATGAAVQLQAKMTAASAQTLGAVGSLGGLDARTLRRLLNLSAVKVSDSTSRRISQCRLEASATAACARAIQRCGRACVRLPPACNVAQCASAPAGTAGLASGYPSASQKCASAPTDTKTAQAWSDPCKSGTCLTAHEAGVLGPQPDDSGCPACPTLIDNPASARVLIEFGSSYPPGGYIAKNHRMYFKVAGTSIEVDLGLPSGIGPGWSGEVKLDVSPANATMSDWKAASGYIVYDLVKPSGTFVSTTFEESAIELK